MRNPASTNRIAAISIAVLGVPGIGGLAIAASPSAIVEARQANFKVMGRSMKGIGDELKKPALDGNVIRTNADALAGAAPKVSRHFPRGTGPESGLKTKALSAIWSDPAGFRKADQQMLSAVRKLQAAARSNNPGAVKAAFPAVGAACKGCHESFRERD